MPGSKLDLFCLPSTYLGWSVVLVSRDRGSPEPEPRPFLLSPQAGIHSRLVEISMSLSADKAKRLIVRNSSNPCAMNEQDVEHARNCNRRRSQLHQQIGAGAMLLADDASPAGHSVAADGVHPYRDHLSPSTSSLQDPAIDSIRKECLIITDWCTKVRS